jgi:RNA polymerase sigma-70 factor (ECF subfamily)
MAYDVDDAAFRTDLTALIPHIRAFARTLCRDPILADDLTQDALAKAWSARTTFEPGTNLRAWTYMILRNLYYSLGRRSWRSVGIDQSVIEQTLVAVTNPDSRLELDELRRAMNMLPEDQREALILVGAGGVSYDEAAQICGTAVGTIKSRVSRARSRLLEIMDEGDLVDDGIEPDGAMASIIADITTMRAGRQHRCGLATRTTVHER